MLPSDNRLLRRAFFLFCGSRFARNSQYYDGKFGYERWEGPFEDDKPHGLGSMHLRDKSAIPNNENGADVVPFEFVNGEPLRVP